MSSAGLESIPRALAVVVAGAVALHEQPALRGGGEPDQRVAALLRALAAAAGPMVDLGARGFTCTSFMLCCEDRVVHKFHFLGTKFLSE